MHLVCLVPKFCISVVFNYSLDDSETVIPRAQLFESWLVLTRGHFNAGFFFFGWKAFPLVIFFPYETSSAAAALQNDFKKCYKRAVKGLAAEVTNFGCFALHQKALWQQSINSAVAPVQKIPELRSALQSVAAKWLRKDKECCYW